MKKTTGRGFTQRTAATTALACILAVGTPLGAQDSGHSCAADRLEGWLGISGITCSHCVISKLSATESLYDFSTEPQIDHVDPNGPTADILRPGDLLVGIDGHLITSVEGGTRFGSIRPGDRVTLRFRRDGKVRSATVTAAGRCLPAELPPEAPAPPEAPEPLPPLRINEAMERVREAMDSLRGGLALPGTPTAPVAPEAPPAPLLPSSEAYLGLSFRCGECSARVEQARVTWSFGQPPEVLRVEPGGSADRAGLRAGDHIMKVDGKPIESPEGGRAFGALTPGKVVLLTVSRLDGSQANVPVTPTEPLPRRTGEAPAPSSPGSDVVRYEGLMGPARISVTGAPVSVLARKASGVLIIRTAENEIRIQVPVGEGNKKP